MTSPDGSARPRDGDPGLAAERTRLAWSRTALAFAVVGGGMLRANTIAGSVVIVLSLPIWAVGRMATRNLRSGALARHFLLVTVLIVAVSLAAMAVVIFGHAPGSLDDLLGRHHQ